MLDIYLRLLDQGYYEVKFAFEGLADEKVWKRPTENLLSVGELAGHIAYGEAVRLAGDGTKPNPASSGIAFIPDLERCRVISPLIDRRFAYHPNTLLTPPSEQHLAMTAEQVCGELLRVHAESVAHLKSLDPDLKSVVPGWSSEWTYGGSLEYLIFHIGYHTGQMYSVRHLLGDTTPDN